MEIEEGKYYVTNGGYIVGPSTRIGGEYPWSIPYYGSLMLYSDDGFISTCSTELNIAKEWSEDTPDARSPISVTDTDENGVKHYLSDYPDTISAEIGGLYEEPKLWRDMTPEEKGALLLAKHEGKKVQRYCPHHQVWLDVLLNCIEHQAYRIKPEPKRETVTLYGEQSYVGFWGFDSGSEQPSDYSITFDLVDGEPDCASIKMEKL